MMPRGPENPGKRIGGGIPRLDEGRFIANRDGISDLKPQQ